MKAVIVDLNGTDAVALRDDGQFVKMKNKNYTIGQELTMQPQIIRFPKQAAVAASAAIVIAACGSMGSYTWSNPISYVSLDINPSIAYSLNEFNRVIAVDGMNDEGAAIVDVIGDSLKNTDITTALTITVEQLSTDAYIDADNTNYMIIGVYSDKDSKANALMSTVDEFTANSVETCSITTVNVSKETKESADSYGITAGKMELINEIASVATDPKEVDPAVLADLTVAELEQTKTAAASGTPVNEAVAAATPDPDESDAPEIPVDPNAIASDSKPTDDSVSTASAKKDESDTDTAPEDNSSASNVAPTTPAGASTAASDKATGSSTNSGSGSASDTGSTDKNGNGSSEKKDESVSSPSKGETTSSEKKDESGSSSSEKKDSSSSSEKKDEVTEDSSQQTNSNLDVELPVELPDEFPEEFPVTDEDGSIVVCSMAV
ncbi:MAG: hypothetical protein J6C00_04420 [Eubacterium sp.]|nr:hypothetical protein [Eubacterium sp.]